MIDIEVLRLALSKEEEAIKMYSSLMISNPNLKDLLYFLINEEEKHKVLIEKQISKLTRP